jgi:DNA-binding SARP family transcriptional activator/Tfp pilus assembly protein PilF
MKSIHLFGGAVLRAGAEPLTGPPAQRHRVALLALLAASWPQVVTRDRAQALLWPEQHTTGARRLLNLAVHVLRRALGETVIRSAGDALLFDPAAVHCDLNVFRAALAGGRTDAAVRGWSGPFLAGFHLAGSPGFDEWAEEERTRCNLEYANALLDCAQRQAADADVHAHVATCRRLVALDPFSAAYALRLMGALDAAGDRSGALRHLAEHEQRLRAELGVGPGAELIALADRMRATNATSAGTPRAADASVVAIIVATSRREHAAVADEFHDRLASRLLRLRSVRVAAQPVPSLRFAHALDVSRLRADAVLEATLACSAAGFRLKVRLVDARSGTFLLLREWEGATLDEVAESATEGVARALTRRPELAAVAPGETRQEVDALIARGHHFRGSRSVDALLKAVACFESACTLEPASAAAWAGAAGTYAVIGFNHASPPREAFALARQAARRALSLDPASTEAHATLGCMAKFLDWDWKTAERELRNAVHVDPASSLAHQWLGNYLLMRAYWPEALAAKLRAARAAPESATAAAGVGWLLHSKGEHERGIQYLDEALHLDPQHAPAHHWRASALLELDRCDEAADTMRTAVRLSPAAPSLAASLAYALARGGARSEAQAMLDGITSQRRERYVPACSIARIHLALGRPAEALRWLDVAARERSPTMSLLRVDPQFAPLQESAGFQRLLSRVGHA